MTSLASTNLLICTHDNLLGTHDNLCTHFAQIDGLHAKVHALEEEKAALASALADVPRTAPAEVVRHRDVSAVLTPT